MQLLFKTIVIVASGLFLLGVASVIMQNKLQDSFGRQAVSEMTQERQFIWQTFVDAEGQSIKERAGSLHNNEALQGYVQAGDFVALNAFLDEQVKAIAGNDDFRIAILDKDTQVLYNSDDRLNSRIAVPNSAYGELLSGSRSELFGLGYDDRQILLLSVVEPVEVAGQIIGFAVYSMPIDRIFQQFQKLVSADIFLVNRYYRPIAGQRQTLWEQFSPYFEESDIKGLHSVGGNDGEFYRLIKFPITAMFGNLQAYGITMSNVSDEVEAQNELQFILNAIFIIIGLVLVISVAFILQRNFRPLEEGAGYLVSLANRENISSLGNEFNDDEIGRILNAIETLRLRTIHLNRLRRSRSKQRQRVHNLLLREMSSLAHNLDDAARREIVDDLEDIKQQIVEQHENEYSTVDTGVHDTKDENDLAAVASTFRRLAFWLSDKDDKIKNAKMIKQSVDVMTQNQQAAAQEESGNELVTVASAFRKLAYRMTEKQKHLNQVIMDLEEALKTEVAYLALQKELNLAHDVQLSFIPDSGMKIGRVELLGFMQPAKTVGGDLFDYFVIDDEHVGFCVGDVSDKGVPAALFMMVARIVLWLVARSESSVSKALAQVNNAIHDNNPNNFFVSIFYGRINVRTGQVDYACAGHPPAILVGKNTSQAIEVEAANDLVAGIFPDVEYAQHSLKLNPGDSLFVYSDGVSEAMDSDDNQYSPERLIDILTKNRCETIEEMVELVISDVKDFTGDCPQSDDITCIAMRYI